MVPCAGVDDVRGDTAGIGTGRGQGRRTRVRQRGDERLGVAGGAPPEQPAQHEFPGREVSAGIGPLGDVDAADRPVEQIGAGTRAQPQPGEAQQSFHGRHQACRKAQPGAVPLPYLSWPAPLPP